jgi:hypothetical protein
MPPAYGSTTQPTAVATVTAASHRTAARAVLIDMTQWWRSFNDPRSTG